MYVYVLVTAVSYKLLQFTLLLFLLFYALLTCLEAIHFTIIVALLSAAFVICHFYCPHVTYAYMCICMCACTCGSIVCCNKVDVSQKRNKVKKIQ